MAVSFPYPLEFLSDTLRASQATPTLRRLDEQSGSGDGRFWTAEMAAPLWQVDTPLLPRKAGEARGIDAKFRALGSSGTMLFADPTYLGPASGATVELARANVTVSGISEDRTALSFSSLPVGYALSAGDRFSIEFSAGRFYMAELLEDRIATPTGATASVGVYPYPPMGLVTGKAVNFVRPTVKVMVPPGGYTPFTYIPARLAQGASVTLLQKV